MIDILIWLVPVILSALLGALLKDVKHTREATIYDDSMPKNEMLNIYDCHWTPPHRMDEYIQKGYKIYIKGVPFINRTSYKKLSGEILLYRRKLNK